MKIGFIDLYLSEWHANHFPDMLKKVCPEAKVTYAWAEREISPVDGRTTDEWCEAFGVTRGKTAGEVCENCDAVMIFAPSDPDCHLRLAKAVLPWGKPTFIDKTFAPDLETAREIFALADEFQTPIYTASALGFAPETDGEFVKAMTFGGGGTPEEYMIHQTEMLAKILGTGARSVRALPLSNANAFAVEYPDERQGSMIDGRKIPFALTLTDKKGTVLHRPVVSDYFIAQATATVAFFKTGIPPVSRERTLEAMALRDAALTALKTPGIPVEVRR